MDYLISLTIKDKFGKLTHVKLQPRPHNVSNSIRIQKTLTVAGADINLNLQVDQTSTSTINGNVVIVYTFDGTTSSFKLAEKTVSRYTSTVLEYPNIEIPGGLGTLTLIIVTVI